MGWQVSHDGSHVSHVPPQDAPHVSHVPPQDAPQVWHDTQVSFVGHAGTQLPVWGGQGSAHVWTQVFPPRVGQLHQVSCGSPPTTRRACDSLSTRRVSALNFSFFFMPCLL